MHTANILTGIVFTCSLGEYESHAFKQHPFSVNICLHVVTVLLFLQLCSPQTLFQRTLRPLQFTIEPLAVSAISADFDLVHFRSQKITACFFINSSNVEERYKVLSVSEGHLVNSFIPDVDTRRVIPDKVAPLVLADAFHKYHYLQVLVTEILNELWMSGLGYTQRRLCHQTVNELQCKWYDRGEYLFQLPQLRPF